MNIHDSLEYMANSANLKGAEQFDIYGGTSSQTSINTFEAKVQKVEISDSLGLGIRFFIDGKAGYAFTESLSQASIDQTVEDAKQHALLSDSLTLILPSQIELAPEESQWNPELENLSIEEMTDFSFEIEAVARQNSLITNVPYNGVSLSHGQSWFLNSNNLSLNHKSNSIYAGLGAMAVQGESSKLGYYTQAGRDFKVFDAKNVAQIAVERAVEMLGAYPIASGEFPILFSNRISASLISMFMSSFFAEVCQKGQSRLVDQLGQKIADSRINFLHKPHDFSLPGATCFDGEGIATQTFSVIQDGILQNYFYNLESAQKANVHSNGCGGRSYSGKVSTTYHNLVWEKGEHSVNELLALSDRCIYVTKLEGSTGCSSISGEISIGIQGFWVEKGVLVHPIDNMTISGNFFEILNQIVGMSSEYNTSWSSFKVPDLLISAMKVSG
jgi:PmbA protein